MKKPDNFIESYKNSDGKTVFIKDMNDKTLMSVYYYMNELILISERQLKEGTMIRSGAKGNRKKTVFWPSKPEQLKQHIKEDSKLRDSLRYEVVQRKLLSR